MLNAASPDRVNHIAALETRWGLFGRVWQASDHGMPFDKANRHWQHTVSGWRTHLERTPEVNVCIMDLCEQRDQLHLVCFRVLRQSNSGNELREHRVPVFPDQISVGVPIADDIPKPKEREQLVACIRDLDFLVCRLVRELGISDARSERDIKLAAARRLA